MKIIMLIALAIIALSNFAFANKQPTKIIKKLVKSDRLPSSELISTSKCNNVLDKSLAELTSSREMIKVQSDGPESEIYRLETGRFGQWLEVHFLKNSPPSFYQISNEKIIKNQFDSNCKIQQSINPGLNFSKSHPDFGSKFVGDIELSSMLKKSNNGIIYIWSPNMAYSVKYSKMYRDIAKDLKINFISLLDPRASSANEAQMAKEFGVPETDLKLNSVELLMRGGTNHYPSLFVFKNGQLTQEMFVGVYDRLTITQKINQALGNQ